MSTSTPTINDRDSPLSIAASIAGILTLLAAIAATLYARLTYLRNADVEYFRVKASLSWFKTESTFMSDLVGAFGDSGKEEREMFGFVVEDLKRLEVRLLEVVEEAENAGKGKDGFSDEGASGGKGIGIKRIGTGLRGGGSGGGGGNSGKGWTVIPRGLRGRTDIAMSWLPVRAKALELLRQREGLASRVLFAQMSMISSRVKDQEARSKKREERQKIRMENLERKLDRLEDLVYRFMHRERTTLQRQQSELTQYGDDLEPELEPDPIPQFQNEDSTKSPIANSYPIPT